MSSRAITLKYGFPYLIAMQSVILADENILTYFAVSHQNLEQYSAHDFYILYSAFLCQSSGAYKANNNTR